MGSETTYRGNLETGDGRRLLAEQQAALGRVATRVAEGATASELFTAVVEEVVAALDVPAGWLFRYEPDRSVSVLASLNDSGFPVGSRWQLDGPSLPATILETGQPARIDDYSHLGGTIAATARESGHGPAFGVPIYVAGVVWGLICVGTRVREPPPADTEARLRDFAELVATAISKAQADDDLRRLVRQKAGLTRVATIVAEGVPAAELFTALTHEVVHALEVPAVSLVRYEADRQSVVLASLNAPDFPVGGRSPIDGRSLLARVLETGRPARVASELRSEVGVPIVVDGEVWGLIRAATTGPEPLRADIEAGLRDFTELVATAISKTESRESLRQVVGEQAALRSVATLVAEGAAPAELFSSVAQEAARILDVSAVSVVRFEPDAWSVVVASFNDPGFPVGSRWPLDGPSLNATVFETGKPAQIDYSELPGPVAAAARSAGLRVGVGVPIVVEGRVWGMIAVGQRHRRDALPAFAGSYTGRIVLSTASPRETQARLAAFTELVATAISKAQAHDDLRGLALEQAALRRVATLVAQDAAPAEIFAAVSAEVDRLFQLDVDSSDLAGVVKFDPGPDLLVVGVSRTLQAVPLGSRWEPNDLFAPTRVLRTGRSARVDEDHLAGGGHVADFLRSEGYLSQVASPIVVGGRLWGAISVNSAETLPSDAADRLEKFTALVATAIANAESHEALAGLAEEQAALRRVATLVARDAPSTELFEVVATEVGQLLDTDITVVGRYDDDGAATAIGSWSASPGGVPVGTRSAIGGRNVLTIVAETGQPARVDGYDDASGEAAEIARRYGWRSSIAAPIVVEDRLWGAMLVATQRPEPFPVGAEERLAAFTDLVATALANAQSHDQVRRFGEEQAALGRVATLVAAGAVPEQVFTAVVSEASSLLGLERIELVRYDGDNTGTVVAASGEHPFPAGSRWSLDDPSVMATVARTTRAARIDDYGTLSGEIARTARTAGFRSAIGAPMTVEGRLWGVIIAISTDPEPIPERSEARLGQFTDLVATAVANAEARQALERVAAEQATLRRIATLVAKGVQPDELFAAVAKETAATFRALTAVMRFEHDPPRAILLGVSEETDLPVGMRWELGEGMASAEVYRTGRPVRLSANPEYWSSREGPVAEMGDRLGLVSRVSCPILVEGVVWGAIAVNSREELPLDTAQRLEKFTELVTAAIANADAKSELAASRRRIVAASDETRRRIERDLHDGTQQRLVSLGLAVRAAEANLPPERDDLRAQLSGVARGLVAVVDDLQEISRGIHPAILSKGGLGPALRALAQRSAIPVDLDITTDVRLAEPVEVAAYFVASEALANAAKHSQASRIDVSLEQRRGSLMLSVGDDGVGGADAGRGSGLVGLSDRVEALGGRFVLESPPGRGTTISVQLPIATPATP
jgi:GAF domain-containing protein